MSDLKKRKRVDEEMLARVEKNINIILLHEDCTSDCFSIPETYMDSPSLDALDEITERFQSCYIRCDAEFDSDEEKQRFEKYEILLESGLFGDFDSNGKARWEGFKVKEKEIRMVLGGNKFYFLGNSKCFFISGYKKTTMNIEKSIEDYVTSFSDEEIQQCFWGFEKNAYLSVGISVGQISG